MTGSITIKSLTNDYTILVLAGPRSRDVLQEVAPDTDWSANTFNLSAYAAPVSLAPKSLLCP